MKRILLIMTAVCIVFGCAAKKAKTPVSVNNIYKIITHRYITFKNESRDAKAAIDFYKKTLLPLGYVNKMPGDGYGGPCSIIDGFIMGGYVKNYAFVPTNKNVANTLELAACNDGEEGDYGYITVSMTVYSRAMAKNVLNEMTKMGFKKFEYDNPEAAGDDVLYYLDNKVVRYQPGKGKWFFEFSIAQ